ncbi:hypothetical protein B0H17DRAFT_18552 [Mycena rosella]|uniref:Uncharacterized protein n=1 Tax=Mycena rosella TaxID=1033263 RepID=A0AAD7D8T2_MYCRO|nr:hypothetical protein B0H17DRAFT_18552 [Mycena rosella]
MLCRDERYGWRWTFRARAATTRIGHDGPTLYPGRAASTPSPPPSTARAYPARRRRKERGVYADSDVPRVGLGPSGSPAATRRAEFVCLLRRRAHAPPRPSTPPRYPSSESHICLHDASTARDAPTLHPIPASLRLCVPSPSTTRTSTSAIDPRPEYGPARDEGATASTNRVEPSPGGGEGLRRDSYERADGGGAVEGEGGGAAPAQGNLMLSSPGMRLRLHWAGWRVPRRRRADRVVLRGVVGA